MFQVDLGAINTMTADRVDWFFPFVISTLKEDMEENKMNTSFRFLIKL